VLLISLMYNGPRVSTARAEQWRLFRLLGADGVAIPQDTVEISGQLGSENREPPSLEPLP
jgi:hypothetical protein